jgi:hypothetical protein
MNVHPNGCKRIVVVDTESNREVTMATVGITKALEGYDRLKQRLKTDQIRKHIKEERMYAGGAAIIGALVTGAAEAKYRAADGTDKKIGPIPVVAGLAAAAAVVGMTDYVPGGVYVGMAGIGGLCYLVGKAANDHVTAAK